MPPITVSAIMPETSIATAALILASSSPYRRALLERLGLRFTTVSPDIDESRLPDESAEALSLRLAQDKARAIAQMHPDALVIGSDQVLACGDDLLGKPGNHANAVKQLQRLSGQSMTFYTSVCVMQKATAHCASDLAVTRVRFRELSTPQIEAYLAAEPAYDCAGSCKAEGLGINLCAAIESDDPTALIGLPLIRLTSLLRDAGIQLPIDASGAAGAA